MLHAGARHSGFPAAAVPKFGECAKGKRGRRKKRREGRERKTGDTIDDTIVQFAGEHQGTQTERGIMCGRLPAFDEARRRCLYTRVQYKGATRNQSGGWRGKGKGKGKATAVLPATMAKEDGDRNEIDCIESYAGA